MQEFGEKFAKTNIVRLVAMNCFRHEDVCLRELRKPQQPTTLRYYGPMSSAATFYKGGMDFEELSRWALGVQADYCSVLL